MAALEIKNAQLLFNNASIGAIVFRDLPETILAAALTWQLFLVLIGLAMQKKSPLKRGERMKALINAKFFCSSDVRLFVFLRIGYLYVRFTKKKKLTDIGFVWFFLDLD